MTEDAQGVVGEMDWGRTLKVYRHPRPLSRNVRRQRAEPSHASSSRCSQSLHRTRGQVRASAMPEGLVPRRARLKDRTRAEPTPPGPARSAPCEVFGKGEITMQPVICRHTALRHCLRRGEYADIRRPGALRMYMLLGDRGGPISAKSVHSPLQHATVCAHRHWCRLEQEPRGRRSGYREPIGRLGAPCTGPCPRPPARPRPPAGNTAP